MVVATLVLRKADAHGRGPPAGLVEDLLWAHIRSSDWIEHIRVRTDPDTIAICFFVRCREQTVANAVIHDIEFRIRKIPALDGWYRV